MNVKFATLLSIVVFGFSAHTEAGIFKVGSDGACTHSSLQAAMIDSNNSGESDVIYLANNMQHRNVAVEKRDDSVTTIRGGFRSCSETQIADMYTVIDGNQLPRPVIISKAGGLYLHNLWITGGTPILSGEDGGGIRIEPGTRQVFLDSVKISHNSATNGGGISIRGRSTRIVEVKMGRVILESNYSGHNGGGLFAEFANGNLTGFLALENIAEHNGGGVWMGRDTVLFNRSDRVRSGFIGNVANNNGGGIALESGGMEMFHVSDSHSPAQISQNRAKNGGGIYVFNDQSDTFASFHARGINGFDNVAVVSGGFAAVEVKSENGERVLGEITIAAGAPAFGSGNPEYCNPAIACNVFSGNRAMDENEMPQPGAMASVTNDGKNTIGFVRFHNSSMTQNIGTNLFQYHANDRNIASSGFSLRNSLVERNSIEKNMFYADGDGWLDVVNTTFAQNNIFDPVFDSTTGLYVQGSIFADHVKLVTAMPSRHSITRLLVRNNDGLSEFHPDLILHSEPGFEDEANYNYHLRPDSPALDRYPSDSTPHDLDLLPRTVDLPTVNDFNTPTDLGCFERQ